MRKITHLLWLVLLISPFYGFSQGYLATYIGGQGNPGGVTASDTETTGWNEVYNGPQSTNSYSDTVAIPFSFEFFGTAVDYLKAAPNGFITFDTSTTVLPDLDAALPAATLPDMSIAAYWDDFPTATGGPNSGDRIMWKVFGQAPFRQLWIKWYSMEIGTGSFAYFAAVLEETSNAIYVVDMEYSSGLTAPQRVGLQNDINTFVVGDNNAVQTDGFSSGASGNNFWAFTPLSQGVDAKVASVSLSSLADNGCADPVSTVTVQVVNIGTQSVSGMIGTFSVNGAIPTFVENIPGTLNAGDTVTHTFTLGTADLSTPGSYDVTGIVTAPGDVDINNDSLTVSTTITAGATLPLPSIDFSTYNGSNLPTIATGWYEAEGFGIPDSGSSSWDDDDFLNDGTNPNGTSARINLYSDFQEDWLISPKFLAEANTFLRFDLGITAFSGSSFLNFGSDDYLEVLVSTDCGDSFTPLIRYDSTSNVSNLGQTEIIQLGAYDGQEIILAFFATDGTFNDDEDMNVYLDNIQISNPSSVEVGATDLDVLTGFCIGANETIQGTIENFNVDPLDFSADPVSWVLQIAGPVAGSFSGTINSGTLASGATQNFTLTTAADLSVNGTYDLTFYTMNPDDGDNSNDTTTLSITVANQIAPYLEDFSGFSVSTGYGAGWLELGGDYVWQVDDGATSSSNTGPGQDHTTGTGNYIYTEATGASTGDSAIIVSPCIDLSALSNPGMSFWYHMYGADMGDLEVWIFTSTDSTQVFAISGEQDTDEAPDDPWNYQSVDLSAYAGQTIRVGFLGIRGADFTSDMGIDDLSIFEATGKDVTPLAIEGPEVNCYFLMDSVLTYQVGNIADSLDLSSDTIFVSMDFDGPGGMVTIVDTITGGGIASGDTLVGTIVYPFTTSGAYTVELSVSLADDQNTSNDELGIPLEILALPLYTAPYTEDFDSFVPSTGGTNPGELGIDWQRNGTDPFAWFVNDGSTPSSSTGPDGDNGGTGNYMYTEASSVSGDTAILTSTCIDLGALTNPALEFYYHMYGSNMGTLAAVVTNLQGMSMVVSVISGEQQGDNDESYKRALADLSAFAGDTISVSFVGIYGGGLNGDIAIDDVSIAEPSGTEVAMQAVSAYSGMGCLPAQDSIQISIANLGAALDLSNDTLFVNASVDGPTGSQTLTDTIATGNLAIFGTLDYAFSSLIDFSQPGTYTLSANVTLAGDGAANDDTLSIDVTQLPTVVIPVGPVDFTGYTGSNLTTVFPGWYEGDGEGTPDTTISSSWVEDDFANDANHPNGSAARVNIYSSSKDEWIVSPRFTADALTILTYDLALTDFASTDPGSLGSDDRLMVMVSTDCGATYTSVKTYDASSTISNTGQSEQVNLSAFAGQDILVGFYATEGTANDPEDVDVFLDNILIKQGDSINGALLSFIEPASPVCGDSMTMGQVIISNLAVPDLTDPMVDVAIMGPDGTTNLSATYNGTLGLGESDTLTFGPFDTYEGGTFDFTVVLNLANDQDLTNDTLTATTFYQSVAPPEIMMIPEVCVGEQVMLMANDTLYSDTDFAWYASDATTQLGTGLSYTTDTLTEATTFYLQRIATGEGGCASDLLEITVEPNPLTSAGFGVAGTGNLFASFADSSENADSVLYRFGDGATSTMASPLHTYADTGTYTVQQIAYGFCGNDTTELVVTITCAFPVADFNATIVPDSNGVTVEFVSVAANADSVLFTFSNGATAAGDTTIDFEFTGQYEVTMVAYNVCGSDTSTLTLNLQNTGLAGVLSEQSLRMYPNPTDGAFTVSLDLVEQADLHIELLDPRGRVIMSDDLGVQFGRVEHRMVADDLAEGLYLVKIVADEQVVVRKLRIE